jgi:hypothetical protein
MFDSGALKRLALLALIVLTAAPAVLAAPDEDPEDFKRKKKLFAEIEKLIGAGDAKALGEQLATDRKIELNLYAVRKGKYRRKQAISLLATFFKAVEPKEVKLLDGKGETRKYKVKYRVRADGKEVESTLHVSLVEEEGFWRIAGILES